MAQGWGRSTWGDGPFGQPAGTTVDVTGVSATSALGNEGILTDQILAIAQSTLTTTLGTGNSGAAVTGVFVMPMEVRLRRDCSSRAMVAGI